MLHCVKKTSYIHACRKISGPRVRTYFTAPFVHKFQQGILALSNSLNCRSILHSWVKMVWRYEELTSTKFFLKICIIVVLTLLLVVLCILSWILESWTWAEGIRWLHCFINCRSRFQEGPKIFQTTKLWLRSAITSPFRGVGQFSSRQSIKC